jgi:WD40 repeat protein
VPPDSRSESATRFDAEGVIHDTVYRRVIARVRGVGGLTFSPDGTRLAVGRAAGGVTVYDAETGFVRLAIDVPGATATRVAFSPDGRWLALADAAGTVHVRHADTGRPACTLAAGGAVTSVAFRPGTAELTAASPVGRTTWAIPAGQPLRTFPGGPTAVAYTPDGARLVTAGDRGGVRVEDVETGQTLHTIATEPPRSVRLAVSPDGHRAAVATAAGVRLIDLDAGRETLALLGADRPTAVAWADAGVFAVADQLLLWRGAATATGCQVPGPHR